jgi:hypothetical protein
LVSRNESRRSKNVVCLINITLLGIKRARKEIARDVKAGEANKFFLSRKASLSSSLEAHDLFPFLTKT